jgi:hypothetical protein
LGFGLLIFGFDPQLHILLVYKVKLTVAPFAIALSRSPSGEPPLDVALATFALIVALAPLEKKFA